MNLTQANQAVKLQTGMDNKEAALFAKALPNHYTGNINWDAVGSFGAYVLTHPNCQDALDFLEGLEPIRLARALSAASPLEARLCGA